MKNKPDTTTTPGSIPNVETAPEVAPATPRASHDYDLWCELNPCPACDGMGTVEDDDGFERECRACHGDGIDPDAPDHDGPPPI